MLSLSARYIIDLRASRFEGTGILDADAEKNELGHVAKVEPDSATVGTSVFSNLVPNYIALLLDARGPYFNLLRQGRRINLVGESADSSTEWDRMGWAKMARTRAALAESPGGDGGAPAREAVARERANTQHWLLEKAIVDLCSASNVVPLTNRHVDLMVRSGPVSIVFEMKSCAPLDVAGPLRRAVWQLLEYRYLYRDELGTDVRLCVVIERRPRASYEWLIGFLQHLAIGIIWRNDGDDGLSCSDFTKTLLGDILPPIKGWKTAPMLWK